MSKHRSVDWNEARRLLRERLRRIAGPSDDLEDLVQESCVRLHRALARGDVREPEGLMTTIAQRTWTDHLRRNMRRRHYTDCFAQEVHGAASPLADDALGDLRERLEFVVVSLFEREGADECAQLASAYFEDHDWKALAERRGLGYAALRKRWSRCLQKVREAFAQDPDLGPLVPRDGNA